MFISAVDNKLAAAGLSYITVIINIALAFLLARVMIGIVRHMGRRWVERSKRRLPELQVRRVETTASLIAGFSRYLFYFIAVAITLGELGLSAAMSSMLAAAGIGGIVIGLGAQSLMSDLLAGLFMLFEDELQVGDYVKIGDVEGYVQKVTLRNVAVKGLRGELNTIQNGQITRLTNFSRDAYMALVDMTIAYEADAERALSLMLEEFSAYAAAHPDIGASAPEALGMTELKDSGVNLRVGMLMKHSAHLSAQRALNAAVKARFKAEDIEIPYNKVVVIQDDKKL